MNQLTTKKVNSIQWRDLTTLSTKEVFIENLVSMPRLLASLLFAHFELYLLALPC